MAAIGTRTRRVEGFEKVTGSMRFTEDLRLPGMLHARLLVSPHPKARIVRIDKHAALAVPGVVAVVTSADLAKLGKAARALLAESQTSYTGEPVAILVAESEAAAVDGIDALRAAAQFDALPAVLSIDEALREGAPLVRESIETEDGEAAAHATITVEEHKAEKPSNIANRVDFTRGDAAAALQKADVVVRRTYTTSRLQKPQA